MALPPGFKPFPKKGETQKGKETKKHERTESSKEKKAEYGKPKKKGKC